MATLSCVTGGPWAQSSRTVYKGMILHRHSGYPPLWVIHSVPFPPPLPSIQYPLSRSTLLGRTFLTGNNLSNSLPCEGVNLVQSSFCELEDRLGSLVLLPYSGPTRRFPDLNASLSSSLGGGGGLCMTTGRCWSYFRPQWNTDSLGRVACSGYNRNFWVHLVDATNT